ncbi:MAG: metallophosphoesterase [Alistipes sp.]|nr:metallophosphoesterase [Alistipes sp.]MBQ6988938.1 metallophosphoesterase [Alistipes sp.]
MKKLILMACTLIMTSVVLAQSPKGEPVIPVYPALQEEGSFSMILVPDPQSYTKFAANQPLFELQTAWIAQNINRLNIKAALFTGDMVEQNGKQISLPLPNPYNGDQTGRQQWEAVSRGLSRLDNRLPYVVAQGNHDIGHITATDRHSLAPEFIRPERNIKFEKCLVSTCPNWEGVHTMENSAYEFTDKAWGKILVITFEFAPRDEAIEWAKQLTESEAYKEHKVIILTHSWLDTAGNRIKEEGYTLRPCNWAEAVWQKLVYPSKNICLVLCGHTGAAPKIEGDVAKTNFKPTSSYRVDKAADGRNIPQMMFNSQQGDGDWNGNGGDCWLRILEFKPDGKTIGVRTFSPMFALSKLTQHLAWRTAEYDQYEIVIE